MMKRRQFITKGSGIAGSALITGAMPLGKEINAVHNSTENETVIRFSGLEKELSIMQISDSHISCDNESDLVYEPYSGRMKKAYVNVKHHYTGAQTTPLQCFEELLTLSKSLNAQFLALSGDLVNYPSQTAVNVIKAMVDKVGIPHFYTAGNHDWHYEGMEGSSDDLRAKWIKSRLYPLYAANPLYSSNIVQGVNIVAIDNSTYQVNEEQLEFVKAQMKKSLPLILFVHIPLYMPGMRICCGHPEWGASSDKGYKLERRRQWSEKGNSPSTLEFISSVMAHKNLVGIFAGHWHQSRSVFYNNQYQYVTGSALNGQYRHIKLIPAV